MQIISETVATLPPAVYRQYGRRERSLILVNPVARLFNDEPNSLQTPVEFLEMLQAHVLLRGNGYAEIIETERAPSALLPLHPDRVTVLRVPGTLTILYDVTNLDGGTKRYVADEIFHLKDRSDDICGKSRLQRARETFAIAEATERFAASTSRNGARLSGVLSTGDELSQTAIDNIKNSFVQRFAGPDKGGSVTVLEEGLKWQSIQRHRRRRANAGKPTLLRRTGRSHVSRPAANFGRSQPWQLRKLGRNGEMVLHANRFTLAVQMGEDH